MLAGGLDQATVAATNAAAHRVLAGCRGRAVGPQDNFAAIAEPRGVGLQAYATFDTRFSGVLHGRVAAPVIAANQHAAASTVAGGVGGGRAVEADTLAEECDVAALAVATGCAQRAVVYQRVALFCLQRNVAALTAVGAEPAAGFEQRIALQCLEDDLAAVADDRGVGADRALIAQAGAVEADAAALREDLAEVDRLCIWCADFDAQIRAADVDELHRAAGGEQNLPVGRVDNAAVFDFRGDQVNVALVPGAEGAEVVDAAGDVAGFKTVFAGFEVSVADVEAGGDQSANVNLRALSEDDSVRVDQIDATIGL